MLKRNVYQGDIDLADHLSGAPSPTGWTKWFGGVLVPLSITWYGLDCILAQDAVLPGRGAWLDLTGSQAVVMGICWLSGGLFLHFHYFWSGGRRLWAFSELGKIVSLLGFISCLSYVVWLIIR